LEELASSLDDRFIDEVGDDVWGGQLVEKGGVVEEGRSEEGRV